ncbi:MAG TPA: response regulator transcription factor [Bacteroidia bacterium]|nr:response regulator transcription factor [Bacteroidia bacterium]
MAHLTGEKRVLIVDDHVIIRRGLKFILESNFGIHQFLEAESCKGFREILSKEPVTHVVLDMQLNDGNVIEILSEMINLYPNIRIMVYTMSPEEIFGARIMNMGVSGFLNKQTNEKEVIKALELFFNDQKYYSQMVKDQLELKQNSEGSSDPFRELSEREITVMSYLLKGEGIKEISGRLNIKSSTVATFKARIFNKLGVSNVIDLKNLAEIYKFKSSVQ